MLEALCENDGAAFRSLLAALRANPAPEMQELYQRFLHSPPALIGYQRIADKKTTIYNGFFGYRRRKGNGKVTRPAFHRTRGPGSPVMGWRCQAPQNNRAHASPDFE